MPVEDNISFGINKADLEEALVRFRRGDMLMCMFYLDRAGFVGIERLWGAR